MATIKWLGLDTGRPTRQRGAALSLLATFALLPGCVTMKAGGGPTAAEKATRSKLSPAEVREASTDLAFRIPAIVEQTGDDILLRADTSLLRKHVLRWKIECTAAFQQAFFRPDAFEAAVATYTLAVQIEQWMDTGEGKSYFGESQSVAVDGARRIRRDIEAQILEISTDPTVTRGGLDKLAEWARKHPINERFTNRPSVRLVLAQLASKQELGASEVLAGFTENLADFGSRVDAYAVTMPKVIRWQTELAAIEFAEHETGKLVLSTLQRSNRLLTRVDDLLSNEGIERLSRMVVASLNSERVTVFGEVDKQRREVMSGLDHDRDVVLGNVNEQRVATLADLDRKITAALVDADAIRARAVSGVEDVATRTLRRAAIGVACLMVLGAVLALLVVWMGARIRRA